MFEAKRITRSYRQTINAVPDVVFPLLCPVREAEWLDGWEYKMVYSQSGLAEPGAVFTTANPGEEDTVWIITQYDSDNHRIDFTRFTPGLKTCVLEIMVQEKDTVCSYVDISYTYTGLSSGGNRFIDRFSEDSFLKAVKFWEKSMNYFLETNERLRAE